MAANPAARETLTPALSGTNKAVLAAFRQVLGGQTFKAPGLTVTVHKNQVEAKTAGGRLQVPNRVLVEHLRARLASRETAPSAAAPTKPLALAGRGVAPFDVRLKQAWYRDRLDQMGKDLQVGGGITYRRDANDNIIGRTPSINPDWFQALNQHVDTRITVKQLQDAIEKAQRGDPLKAREQRVIAALLDELSGERQADLPYRQARRDAARALRAEAKRAAELGLPPADAYADLEADAAGSLYAENEYDPAWEDEARALLELAIDADKIDPDATEAALESQASDAVVAARLWAIIRGQDVGQQPVSAGEIEGQQGPRPRAAEETETAEPRAVERLPQAAQEAGLTDAASTPEPAAEAAAETAERAPAPAAAAGAGTRAETAPLTETQATGAPAATVFTYDRDTPDVLPERLPGPDPETGVAQRRTRPPTAIPGQIELFTPDGEPTVPRPERRRITPYVKSVVTGHFRSGLAVVNSAEDAAHVLAPLRKSAQEHLLALVLDENNRPIEIVRHTIGGPSGSQAFPPILLGAIHAVPGARRVWLGHNHPAGYAEQSQEDMNLTRQTARKIAGTGIELLGMIVVAPSGAASVYYETNEASFPLKQGGIEPRARTTAIPVTERLFRGRRSRLEPIKNERDALAAIQQLNPDDRAGVLLLNVRHVPVQFLPLSTREMTRLRTREHGTGASRIYRAIHEANAEALILYMPELDRDAQANVYSFAQVVGINYLDTLTPAGHQELRLSAYREDYFRRGETPGEPGAAATLEAAVADQLSAWQNAPEVIWHDTPADAPFAAPADALGAYSGGVVHLFRSNLKDAQTALRTLLHETIGHRGLRGVFEAPALAAFLRRVAKDHSTPVRRLMADLDVDELTAAEEYLARLAETDPRHSLIDRALVLLRQLARKLIPDLKWSRAELLEVLRQAQGWTERGDAARMPGQTRAPVFATKASFSRTVEDVLSGDLTGRQSIEMGKTPPVLRALGVPDLPLVTTAAVIDKAHFDHGLTRRLLQRLPELIADPVFVLDSQTQPGALVVVIEEFHRGAPVIIAIHPDKKSERILVNFVASAYGKDQASVIGRWFKAGLLRYQNQQKSPLWSTTAGLQLPRVVQSRKGSPTKIVTERDLVNETAPGGPLEGPGSPVDTRFSRADANDPETAAPASLLDQWRTGAYRIIDTIEKVTESITTLPERARYLAGRYQALGKLGAAEQLARDIKHALFNAGAADKAALYRYLTTAGLPPDQIAAPGIRAQGQAIKRLIEQTADRLVERGLLSQDSREAYRDRYLPRLYFKHLLDDNDWSALQAGKKPSAMGYLKKRQDLPEEVRKVILGEIKDPGFLAAVAVTRPLRDVALLDWLDSISHNEAWALPKSIIEFDGHRVTPQWLLSEAGALRERARHYEDADAQQAARAKADEMEATARAALDQLRNTEAKDWRALPDQARFGRLRGLHVRKEIYDDLMGSFQMLPENPSWPERLLGYGGIGTQATALWKLGKVALNPPSQVRNFVSNAVLLQLSGVPLHQLIPTILRSASEIRNNGRAWRIAKQYGVTESTFTSQELLRLHRDLIRLDRESGRYQGPLRGAYGLLKQHAAALGDSASDLYQWSEALFKTAKILHGTEHGLTPEKAALEAQKWLFDYSAVSRSVRYLRNAPIGAPFLTFTAKIAPRLVEAALLHPQRLAPWALLFYGWQAGIAELMDIEDEDDLDKLKLAGAEWMQDRAHFQVLPYKDERGRWAFADLGYFFPWSQWVELAHHASAGDLYQSMRTLGILGGPIPDLIVASKTGIDPFTGRPIMDPADPPARQAAALMNYLWSMAAPPFLTDHGALGKFKDLYLDRAVDQRGEPTLDPWQAALRLVGINVYNLDPELSRAQNIQRMRREIEDVIDRLKYELKRTGSPEKRASLTAGYLGEVQRRRAQLQDYSARSTIPASVR